VTVRVAIEAAATDGWYRFVGCDGTVIGLDRFGVSAPAKEVYKECRLTVGHVIAVVNDIVQKREAHKALLES